MRKQHMLRPAARRQRVAAAAAVHAVGAVLCAVACIVVANAPPAVVVIAPSCPPPVATTTEPPVDTTTSGPAQTPPSVHGPLLSRAARDGGSSTPAAIFAVGERVLATMRLSDHTASPLLQWQILISELWVCSGEGGPTRRRYEPSEGSACEDDETAWRVFGEGQEEQEVDVAFDARLLLDGPKTESTVSFLVAPLVNEQQRALRCVVAYTLRATTPVDVPLRESGGRPYRQQVAVLAAARAAAAMHVSAAA